MKLATLLYALSLGLMGGLGLASPARAQYTYYTDKAAFLAASGATLQATFDGVAAGPKANFVEGNLFFQTYGGQLYVIPTGSTDTSPVPTSQALAGNGSDDIGVRFHNVTGTAIGFEVTSNSSSNATVRVTGTGPTLLGTFINGLGPNQRGFVGIICPTGLVEVRWTSVNGHIQDAPIDNVYATTSTTALQRTAWSRIKAMYR